MIAILSPAKNMQRESSLTSTLKTTEPCFLNRTEQLWRQLKEYQPWELESFFGINEKLAVQAFMDFQDFSIGRKGSPALLTYEGLVYKNIKAENFSQKELEFANEHVRMISAYYGLLQPLDGILPYRLEMQCRVKIEGQSLYQFWKEAIYEQLFKDRDIVVNLASDEYAKCIRGYLVQSDQWIDIEFLSSKNGKLKVIPTIAKMARGQMIRFMIEERIHGPKDLQGFEWNGYSFKPSLSYPNKYVFLQK